MKGSILKFSIYLFIAVLAVVFLTGFIFKDRSFLPGFIKTPGAYVFNKLEGARIFLSALAKWKNLAYENGNLKKENLDLTGQLAEMNFLKGQNDFSRKSANLADKFGGQIIYGSIFSASAFDFYLNKGSEDGVASGDVIASEDGILIGIVRETHNNFSRISVVNNADFKVTAKTLDFGTSGIARGGLSEGMYLDLVVQGDQIKEGDMLVTSGDDLFPPALIIGTVDYVDLNNVQVFKNIRIKPAFQDIVFGKVLILHK